MVYVNPDIPPAPAAPPPDPKLLAMQARTQADQAAAAHEAQIEQQKAQDDVIHQQAKTQSEIALGRINAGTRRQDGCARRASEGRDRTIQDAAFIPASRAKT